MQMILEVGSALAADTGWLPQSAAGKVPIGAGRFKFGTGRCLRSPPNQPFGGLDHWQIGERKRVFEERLEGLLRDLLSRELTLYGP